MATTTLEKPTNLEAPCLIESGVSFDEFIEAPRFDSRHVEWVDGEVFEKMSVSDEHSQVIFFLAAILISWTEDHHLGEVVGDPYVMRLEAQGRGRAPDIMFVATENLARLHRNRLDGPADVVVEVISPGSNSIDRGDKFDEYQDGGVGEYWIIDPQRREALFYQRDDEGIFRPMMPQNGIFRSNAVTGFELQIGWLWQRPSIRQVLNSWA